MGGVSVLRDHDLTRRPLGGLFACREPGGINIHRLFPPYSVLFADTKTIGAPGFEPEGVVADGHAPP